MSDNDIELLAEDLKRLADDFKNVTQQWQCRLEQMARNDPQQHCQSQRPTPRDAASLDYAIGHIHGGLGLMGRIVDRMYATDPVD